MFGPFGLRRGRNQAGSKAIGSWAVPDTPEKGFQCVAHQSRINNSPGDFMQAFFDIGNNQELPQADRNAAPEPLNRLMLWPIGVEAHRVAEYRRIAAGDSQRKDRHGPHRDVHIA
jgi:hypothetical protein